MNLAPRIDVVNLASPVGVVNLALPVGVVNLASPVGVVNLAPPVGVVNLAPLGKSLGASYTLVRLVHGWIRWSFGSIYLKNHFKCTRLACSVLFTSSTQK